MSQEEKVRSMAMNLAKITDGRLALGSKDLNKLIEEVDRRGFRSESMEGALVGFYMAVMDKSRCVNNAPVRDNTLAAFARILAYTTFGLIAVENSDVVGFLTQAIHTGVGNDKLTKQNAVDFLNDKAQVECVVDLMTKAVANLNK